MNGQAKLDHIVGERKWKSCVLPCQIQETELKQFSFQLSQSCAARVMPGRSLTPHTHTAGLQSEFSYVHSGTQSEGQLHMLSWKCKRRLEIQKRNKMNKEQNSVETYASSYSKQQMAVCALGPPCTCPNQYSDILGQRTPRKFSLTTGN